MGVMSEIPAGDGGEQCGGGKRPYEPPRVLGLGPVDEGRGIGDCAPGSGNALTCRTGNSALTGCSPGNMYFM
jgi:hypothetical protein